MVIRVAVTIDAPVPSVWEHVRRIEGHTSWMADAESITFTSERHAGVGTTFDCVTKVGPIRLLDRMEVTEWIEERVMGIRHVGAVTGTGRFTLAPTDRGATRFAWDESLRFPWWLGGPVGVWFGAFVLRAVWKRNLVRLKTEIERAPAPPDLPPGRP